MPIKDVFHKRPFRIRNADEYSLENILNLFVSPTDGLNTPFDYENTIIKGRMGSGKTMYLRANYAYYLYQLVPSLIEKTEEAILPVHIKLSDFQHIKEPDQIYKAIIIKIIEEITSIYIHLQDQKRLAALHCGFQLINDELIGSHKLANSMKQLSKLGSDEYIERVTTELNTAGKLKSNFIELSAGWGKTNLSEIKKKPNPGIKDIEECYKNLLESQEGKILLLIDEAGSLDKKFFKKEDGTAFFEILMNQFRTAEFMRTKIAVYPNSYSDMLTETRYGDTIKLEESTSDERGYKKFRTRAVAVINSYLNPDSWNPKNTTAHDIFEINNGSIYGDCIEQLLYASSGNMRRLIQLLDTSMNAAYKEHNGERKVTKEHVIEALHEHAEKIEDPFTGQEKEFLDDILAVCKSRRAFKFKFPSMSPILYKYANKSQEFNIIIIDDLGSGRRGTTYSLDYSYAVLKDIPTHHIADSEKINKDRTLKNGKWINRVATISEELIQQAALPGKIEGIVSYVSEDVGFINSDNGTEAFFQSKNIIKSDTSKSIKVGMRVKFYPVTYEDGTNAHAHHIEVLS